MPKRISDLTQTCTDTMRTETAELFFNNLGIQTKVVNENKGLIELPNQGGLIVAVCKDTESHYKASKQFRDLSSQTGRVMASCVDLRGHSSSTLVPGIDGFVPVFSVYAGRFEDQFGTNGNQLTSSRLLMLMKELEAWDKKATAKTPYLKWLCGALGIPRVRSLTDLQDLVIEASQHPEADKLPVLKELSVGRGTRSAVLCVGSSVQHRDTEPVVDESDWKFIDVERLVMAGITDTQANVIRKTARALTQTLAADPAPVAQQEKTEDQSKERLLEMLGA